MLKTQIRLTFKKFVFKPNFKISHEIFLISTDVGFPRLKVLQFKSFYSCNEYFTNGCPIIFITVNYSRNEGDFKAVS